MPNIEIKARYEDLEKARVIAKRLGARFAGLDHQIDTYFKAKEGRLKLRESSLKGAQLVPYVRPNQAGPKKSEYQIIALEDAGASKALLGKILGIDAVVDKKRS